MIRFGRRLGLPTRTRSDDSAYRTESLHVHDRVQLHVHRRSALVSGEEMTCLRKCVDRELM